MIGGGGGGNKDVVSGGGNKPENLELVLNRAKEVIATTLS
jgi:alanyl-tRNA synthetase